MGAVTPTRFGIAIRCRLRVPIATAILSLAAVSDDSHAAATQRAESSDGATLSLSAAPNTDFDSLATALGSNGIEVVGLLIECNWVVVPTDRCVNELVALFGLGTIHPSPAPTASLSESSRPVDSDAIESGFNGTGQVIDHFDPRRGQEVLDRIRRRPRRPRSHGFPRCQLQHRGPQHEFRTLLARASTVTSWWRAPGRPISTALAVP